LCPIRADWRGTRVFPFFGARKLFLNIFAIGPKVPKTADVNPDKPYFIQFFLRVRS
jgi:hypothetical protein